MNFSFGNTAPATNPPTLGQPATLGISAPGAQTQGPGTGTGFSFGLSAQTNPTTTTSSLISMPTATTAPPPVAATNPITNLTTTTVTTQSGATNANQLNFCQLEEYINKWSLELEEEEKIFTNQATQVNAWDKVLLSNGKKIVELNQSVEKVKAEQEAMEQELEFITAQHAELEECIIPLEEELSKIPQVDIERGQTYLMAETLDSQLKQMSEDLKEVVEHLNEANKISDPNDPMVQIGKILNAHMNSLQWIENSTSIISNKLDQISKLHSDLRKDNERSFRLTYYDN